MADLSTLREVILPSVFSWKSLAIVLALLNLKNIPFSWHVRIHSYPQHHQSTLTIKTIDPPPNPPPPQPPPLPDLPSLPYLSSTLHPHHQGKDNPNPPHLLPAHAHHAHLPLGNRLQLPQIKQHLFLRSGHLPNSHSNESLHTGSSARELGARPRIEEWER